MSGQANKEIARQLNLREPTIKLHVKTICRKRDARNRTHAAMIARERALCRYHRRAIAPMSEPASTAGLNYGDLP